MKAINLRNGLLATSCALTCLLVGTMVFATPAWAGVEGKVYKVKGRTSKNVNFDTCYRFDNINTLTIDGLGGQLTYAQSSEDKWQAVRRIVPGVGISGKVESGILDDGNINGRGINSNGTTFNFTGELSDAACGPSGADPDGSVLEQ